MIIVFQKKFDKSFKKLPLKSKEKFYERLTIFQKDQFDPTLNNHSLQGKYLGYRNINITGDLRAIYIKRTNEVTFIDVGSHSNLYD